MLILDEVMAGFGRTGKWFACEHWDVVPDILCVAKGINSGYVPLGAMLADQPKLEDVRTLSDDGRFSVWAARKRAQGGGGGEKMAGKRKREGSCPVLCERAGVPL